MCIGVIFRGEFGVVFEVNQPPPCSAEVKNKWSITSTPSVCHGVDKEKLYFMVTIHLGLSILSVLFSDTLSLFFRRYDRRIINEQVTKAIMLVTCIQNVSG